MSIIGVYENKGQCLLTSLFISSNNYNTLFTTQVISIMMAQVSNYFTCTSSCLVTQDISMTII